MFSLLWSGQHVMHDCLKKLPNFISPVGDNFDKLFFSTNVGMIWRSYPTSIIALKRLTGSIHLYLLYQDNLLHLGQ